MGHRPSRDQQTQSVQSAVMDARFDLGGEDGELVLRIIGDLDIAVEDDAVTAVDRALATDPPPALLLIDLSEVEFMDSSGLRALLRIHNRHGSQVRLGPVSTVVERLLHLTGTADLFDSDQRARPHE
jgi:anti-anti-sigma factor